MTEEARFRPAADVLGAFAGSPPVDGALLRRDLDAAVDPSVHDPYVRRAVRDPADVEDGASAPSRT